MYLGVTGQGRSPKRVFLRTCLALMAAAQKLYTAHKREEHNSADPYMTLVGYFNSLRELGGARRLIEDEVSTSLVGFGERMKIGATSFGLLCAQGEPDQGSVGTQPWKE